MIIHVKVKPNSSKEKMEKISDDNRCATFVGGKEKSRPLEIRGRSTRKIKGFPRYNVWIKEKPIENKANVALEKFLKKYFNKPVKIIKGLKSREKIVEIN